MKVNCFTVRRPIKNTIEIDTIYKEFENVPRYCKYEGSMNGLVYLCCLDIMIDAKSIFNKYGYDCHKYVEINVDISHYNSSYRIAPTYTPDIEYELIYDV